MPKTIFAVSTGDYSDYMVHALFETRELAEQYIVKRDEESRARAKERNWPFSNKFWGEIEEFDYYEGDTLVYPGAVTGDG